MALTRYCLRSRYLEKYATEGDSPVLRYTMSNGEGRMSHALWE